MSLIIKDLCKLYDHQHILKGISFESKEGEIVGFLGPNGAGKSTTMKIATGYLPPSSGSATICGYSIEKECINAKKYIGYLPEHNPLYLNMYVHEYLRFTGSIYCLKGKNLKDRVKEIIARCGLTPEQNKKIGMLSKGYRQRVGLAQALVHNPKVLILDEPTTGLDPNQIVEIRKLIKEVSPNKTVILSTHIMQEVQAICDRVVIIHQGEIVADKAVDDLKSLNYSLQTTIVAFFRAEYEPEALMVLLSEIEGVKKVSLIPNNRYAIQSAYDNDIRVAIFNFAKQNNLTLIELKQEESDLETVFRALTK